MCSSRFIALNKVICPGLPNANTKMILCILANRCLGRWYYYFTVFKLTKNPTFSGFDFLGSDDDTLRLNNMILRIYAKPHSATNYTLLIEHDISLCCLQFIGRDVILPC